MKQSLILFLNIFIYSLIIAIGITSLTSCDADEPKKEDTPELITQATLTFTPSSGSAVIVTATDPDGEGAQDLTIDGPINLEAQKSYTLEISLINGLAKPGDPEYDITKEVEEEGHEHRFFFGWTSGLFSNPAGNGNLDNGSDDVKYEDSDEKGLPIGLSTSWTTGAATSGNFRVVLKHQPELKTASSDSNTGETDLDITFEVNIQ
jgi:hypothetical protein